jgi:hypothetical protein
MRILALFVPLLVGCTSSTVVVWPTPEWSPEQVAELGRAAAYWNTVSHGQASVELVTGDKPPSAIPIVPITEEQAVQMRWGPDASGETHRAAVGAGHDAIFLAPHRLAPEDLASVAAHEFGHALGLHHVGNHVEALMNGEGYEELPLDLVGKQCLTALDADELCRAVSCETAPVLCP